MKVVWDDDEMKNVQTVLFDLDGTISDSKEGITKSIAFALEQMGRPVPPLETLSLYIGPPFRQIFKTIFATDDLAQIEKAITFYRQRYITEEKGVAENSLYPHIVNSLKELKKNGKQLYVATSKSIGITRKIIRHFSMENLFEGIYGSELDGTREEKSELISYVLSCENIASSEAVMIGDRKNDIIGAKKNNMRSIGACWGYGSVEELREAGATALADRPEMLLDILLS